MRSNLYKLSRRFAVLAIGLPLIGLGIILIPLPGPGLLVMLAGLFVLSLEFDWAKRRRDEVSAKLKEIIAKNKPK